MWQVEANEPNRASGNLMNEKCGKRRLCACLLQESAGHVAEVEAEAAKTARELADFKAESAGLRNQDLTLRRLEEKNRSLETQLVEKVRW